MVADFLQQQDTATSPITRNDSTRSRDPHRSIPLKTIGNYSLQQSIGKGSMGKVKLGVHNVTGEKIAVKIVPRANLQLLNQPSHTTGKSIQQIAKEKAREENREVRTIREAHIMMLLKHPNIVGMKDLVMQGPYFYILMDYVNGGQLLHYIVKRQRLSDRRTRQFSRQIVSALDYLHRNSIVHRDLKIENIMIDKSGRNIKIIDFGLSNLFCPERQLTTYCGSLYFAAPELLKATPYSGPEVDVWSLGVVIYVMATGSVPFDDKSMPGLHDKIKKGHVNYPAHLSDECKDLLSHIFITDPKQRIIMTDILHHPWLNKESASINNYMPSRKPLTLPLNPKVIERMSQGFNLGTTDEIEKRLTLIIQSPVYHDACQHISDCHARRSPSPSHSYNEGHSSIIYDDPQSVPAAYHPFLSLYYLSQERQIAMEHESHHYRVAAKSSLSRKASLESLGGNSSARSSQASLVGADEDPSNIPRLLTEVPISHTPVIPQPHNASGAKLQNDGSLLGYVSQPAAIGSTNYLSRIQRWLRSSLSQHHLASDNSGHITAPPSPPQHVEDSKHAEVDLLFVTPAESSNRLPTPSHSTDDRCHTVSSSPNDSFHSTTAELPNSEDNKQNLSATSTNNIVPAGGSKSLFRKLSQAFLRKNSSKSLNKKSSNLSNTNTVSDQNASEEEVTSVAIMDPHVSNVNETPKEDMPPPVPPKDAAYLVNSIPPPRMSSMTSNTKAVRQSQLLPPGMSIATVTSRQTAHTIDISTINNQNRHSHNAQPNSIPTPIAAKMAKYEDPPSMPKDSSFLLQPSPNVSRSASFATPNTSQFQHRRRGSVTKLTGKIGSWLNRSSSFNHSSKPRKEA
ncbi:kinase-like domain-containing protein [Mucor mucedo]|uniref:kinase-like domain-containing protein n=1 Tax=Mucor mucedo TaxID=29922 RepID=UPI00221F1CFA|nr:kinase-like domain-containing protein [Mucor mucedo]KAI7892950.1 kinase-like domain-containing protein [Mucor mucedo]